MASELGFEWICHPLVPDVPLKFGLGQDWQKSVERKDGNGLIEDDVESRYSVGILRAMAKWVEMKSSGRFEAPRPIKIGLRFRQTAARHFA